MKLDILQAIELAISHEMEARRNYLALAEETDDPELRRLLQEIAQEEAGHEATLRSRLRLYEQRVLLRDTLSRYLSPAMTEEILKNPESLQLGGQRRRLTALFADIKGFTSLSEKMDPAEVVDLLNHYFTAMVDLVFDHQGTLDKFLGDGLLAFFGAPLEVPRAASRAVACAVAMPQRLHDLRFVDRLPVVMHQIGQQLFRLGIAKLDGFLVRHNRESAETANRYAIISDAADRASFRSLLALEASLQRSMQAFLNNRLQNVIDRVHTERIHRIFLICRYKRDTDVLSYRMNALS